MINSSVLASYFSKEPFLNKFIYIKYISQWRHDLDTVS